MHLRTLGLALVAGVAALLAVGVLATELGTAAGIEFSLFVGIPAGLAAGFAAGTVVLLRFEDLDPARRRPAVALAGYGVAFVVALVVAVGLGLRNSLALPVAALVGVGGAVAAVVRWAGGRQSRP